MPSHPLAGWLGSGFIPPSEDLAQQIQHFACLLSKQKAFLFTAQELTSIDSAVCNPPTEPDEQIAALRYLNKLMSEVQSRSRRMDECMFSLRSVFTSS